MKILRTILMVLAALAFVIFAAYNWQPVELKLWQDLVWESKLPVPLVLAFALGFVPMWLVHRSVVWGLQRRVKTLETSLKNTALAQRSDSGTAPFVADSPVDKSGKSSGEGDLFGSGVDSGDGGGDGGGD